ncbi:hypothetical protein KC19_3G094800 [Ceratodon purpureus]|uniref:Malic enzyme NAD-binding domain-containing protein n=1 Tax=Ceratodon purpureus TaxID=3225 RepID=A0A8T0IIR8_CERPU|nr:hypothetical protein KC19_3G094800 [Ceratodon purpureus]
MQGKIPVEEARKAIHLVDSKGLVMKARFESLQEFKRPWAHDHPPAHDLLSAVKALKPTVLIGTSGKGGTFTKEVLEEISSYHNKPVIMALSNPTSQSECTAEEAYKYTKVCHESFFTCCCIDFSIFHLGSQASKLSRMNEYLTSNHKSVRCFKPDIRIDLLKITEV